MRRVAEGVRTLFHCPRLWPLALGPLVVSVVAYIGVVAACVWFVSTRLGELAALINLPTWAGAMTGSASVLLLTVLWSGPVFMILFGFVGIPFWESLGKGTEKECTGSVVSKTRLSWQLVQTAIRVAMSLVALFVALVSSLLGHPWIAAFVTGGTVLLDLTAPPLLRRGIGTLRQIGWLFRQPGWIGLWVALSAATYVPVIGAVFLPVFAVASTLMVLRDDSANVE